MRPEDERRVAGEPAGVSGRELELKDRGEPEAVVALGAQDPDLAVDRDVAEALVVETARAAEAALRVVEEAGHGDVGARADDHRDLHTDDQEVGQAEVEVQRAGELRVDHASAQEPLAALQADVAAVDQPVEGQHPEAAVEDQAEADPEVRQDVGAVDREVALRVDGGPEEVEVHAAGREPARPLLRVRGRHVCDGHTGEERESEERRSEGGTPESKSEHRRSPMRNRRDLAWRRLSPRSPPSQRIHCPSARGFRTGVQCETRWLTHWRPPATPACSLAASIVADWSFRWRAAMPSVDRTHRPAMGSEP